MPQEITSYCPQCLLVVFAAMGFYQYVMRDRLLNGDATDDMLETDIDEMDEATQLMLLDMLTNSHQPDQQDRFTTRMDDEIRSA